jgi:hypothetical protein
MRAIFKQSVIFIDTSELMKPVLAQMASNSNEIQSTENRTINRTECEIVNSLCETFHKVSFFKSIFRFLSVAL